MPVCVLAFLRSATCGASAAGFAASWALTAPGKNEPAATARPASHIQGRNALQRNIVGFQRLEPEGRNAAAVQRLWRAGSNHASPMAQGEPCRRRQSAQIYPILTLIHALRKKAAFWSWPLRPERQKRRAGA